MTLILDILDKPLESVFGFITVLRESNIILSFETITHCSQLNQ